MKDKIMGAVKGLAGGFLNFPQIDDDGAVCVTVSSLSRLFTDEMLNSRNCMVLICQRLTNSDGEVLPRKKEILLYFKILKHRISRGILLCIVGWNGFQISNNVISGEVPITEIKPNINFLGIIK